MPTIREVIERVDRIKINDFPEEVKLGWISALDGKVAVQVYLLDVLETSRFAYRYPADLQSQPLIDFPYDDLYDLWLQAKIDFANGEFSQYQNAMEMFNSHYYDFVQWVASTYDPAQGGKDMGRGGYLLSAYGLAVKLGFAGSELDFLRGLVGKAGKDGENGFHPQVQVEKTDEGNKVTITYKIQNQTEPIDAEILIPDGHTPVKGIDYFTDAEKQELVQAVAARFTDGMEVAY